MTGPLENSEFCFLRISMFLSTSSRETLRFSGNKIHCSPQNQSLCVKYFITTIYHLLYVNCIYLNVFYFSFSNTVKIIFEN